MDNNDLGFKRRVWSRGLSYLTFKSIGFVAIQNRRFHTLFILPGNRLNDNVETVGTGFDTVGFKRTTLAATCSSETGHT